MSEDRLEKALQAMKDEHGTPEQVADAGKRVWDRLGNPGAALCSEFRLQFREYLDGRLADNRRLLMEDHLGRCLSCRARLVEEQGEGNVVPMPARRIASWPRWGAWAAAAAIVLISAYIGRDHLDGLFAPRGPRATVVSLRGGLYLVTEGPLGTGSPIGENDVIRTGPGAKAVLKLHDGSLVDINESTELSVHAAWSGQSIRLERGDIIVKAAKQRRGHLRVETRDSVASVRGTIFAVSAGFSGSVVSVVEGAVAVTQPGSEVVLRPGQQAASNPAMASSVQNAISWNPDAKTYLAGLASVARIEKALAETPSPLLPTQSSLLPFIPLNTLVYGAVPNLGGTIDQAVSLIQQQALENPALRRWWNSGAAGDLKKLVGRVQTVWPLLGDEIAWGICANSSPTLQPFPILLARVQQGKRAELAAALDEIGAGINAPLKYQLTDTLLAASNSATNLQWLRDHMGQGAGTPFAKEIAGHYRDGVAGLLGIDVNSVIATSGTSQHASIHEQQVKYLFWERRSSQGSEENEMAVSFNGPRTGLASTLASEGSGGAAEYLSSDSLFAVYVSTREPQQLFDELMAQLARLSPDFQSHLVNAETQMGISFSNDLARAIGTESAFSINGLSATGPSWTMSVLVNDASILEATIRKLANSANAGLQKAGKTERVVIEQEVVNGRTWTTMKFPPQPFAITWTYDRGYLVAAGDRGTATQAVATRNGGSPLPWSAAFQQQLPPSAGLHPSGFVWLDTKGAFQGLAALVPNPAIQKLISEQDPILVMFSGTMEQIRILSRTRLSGMVMNLILMQGVDRAHALSNASSL